MNSFQRPVVVCGVRRITRWFGIGLMVVIATAGLAVSGRPASATDWSSRGLDAAGTRATAELMGVRFASLWSMAIPTDRPDPVYRSLLASPAVADGYVATATYGNKVRVVRESDGAALWEASVGDAVIASPLIDRGWVYVPCLDRNLYAFRLSDGKLLWKTDLGGIAYASPAMDGGALFVAAGAPQPRLLRVNAENGQVAWTAGADLLQQSLDSSVVVAGGHVIVGEVNGHFHSFAATDGHHQWTTDVGGLAGLASPVALADRVYLPTGGTTARVVAVELGSGALVPNWSADFTSSVVGSAGPGTLLGRSVSLSSLAVSGGLILVNARADDRMDVDMNGLLDLYRLREETVAMDALTGRVVWAAGNGARDATDANLIPTHGLVPTPAVYRALKGDNLAVVGSSLAARATVLAVSTGAVRTTFDLPSVTRASPVTANGRLILATDAGALVALGSLDNRAPATPAGLQPAGGIPSDAGGTVVRWRPAMDLDGDAVTYQLRWDTDGEILHSALGEVVTDAGVTSWRLPGLAGGLTVTYALRARDTRGAWSAWSVPQIFSAINTPPVQVGTSVYSSLLAALSAARPGDVIRLGLGRYPLAETMNVPSGVSVQGAGPQATVIEGRGLARAITVSSSSAAQPSALRDLTIKGAATGVATEQGAHALLQNVVIRDNTAFGIDVGASGVVTVISATLFRNDVAARSFGRLDVRNSIVTQNRRGYMATPADAVLSRYNDLFANKEDAYGGVTKGAGDLAVEVSFKGAAAGDLRVQDESRTTDRGDPADDFAREPAPNGNRVNMGAFAGTEQAELSQTSSTVASESFQGPAPVESPVTDPPSVPSPRGPAATPAAAGSSGGCTVDPAAGSRRGWWGAVAVLALVLGRRRRARDRDES